METHSPPEVIIAGGGLGGLFFGALLEKAGIPYIILERANTVKALGRAELKAEAHSGFLKGRYVLSRMVYSSPHIVFVVIIHKMTGSAISIGATLLPLFDQLGLLDDFVAIGKPSVRCMVNREGDQVSFANDFTLWKEL